MKNEVIRAFDFDKKKTALTCMTFIILTLTKQNTFSLFTDDLPKVINTSVTKLGHSAQNRSGRQTTFLKRAKLPLKPLARKMEIRAWETSQIIYIVLLGIIWQGIRVDSFLRL